MKHSLKIVTLLLLMFFSTQLIGLAVTNAYHLHNDNIPFGMSPPKDISPASSLVSIIFAIVFAVLLMLLLMRFRIELFLRLWFFFVITIAIGITVNALFMGTSLSMIKINLGFFSTNASSLLALLIALPIASIKVFNRNLIVHNASELLIYPGIAIIFIPLLADNTGWLATKLSVDNTGWLATKLLPIWPVVLLLILISIYDIYAVWHAGFMQKMAKYQIQNLKVFAGFFIPYLGKKERELVKNINEKKLKARKIKVNVAILGGGDVVFPIILAGVVLRQIGFVPALIVSLCATLALMSLFYISKKGKFYPAMPFISAGCFFGLGIVYVLSIL